MAGAISCTGSSEANVCDNSMDCWMARLPDNLPICKVSMPGTHDSATYGAARWGYIHEMACTQDWDLQTQLAAGIRFFDLRVKSDGRLYHGFVPCELTLKSVLKSLASFLHRNSSEYVLIRIKDEEQSSSSANAVHSIVKGCALKLPLRLSKHFGNVGDMRGHLAVLQDWDGPEVSMLWESDSMCVQDVCTPRSLESKWDSVSRALKAAGRSDDRRLHVNFVSAHGVPIRTPRYFAEHLIPRVQRSLEKKISCYKVLGTIVMDFPTSQLCATIIRSNFASGPTEVLRRRTRTIAAVPSRKTVVLEQSMSTALAAPWLVGTLADFLPLRKGFYLASGENSAYQQTKRNPPPCPSVGVQESTNPSKQISKKSSVRIGCEHTGNERSNRSLVSSSKKGSFPDRQNKDGTKSSPEKASVLLRHATIATADDFL
eukprot:TRINITY_DN33552_c0_g1_i1.p1 TRINITY_DN33552_c0_g1~~TRINITY_DN33552_c0_g1_i1.p1  ORF type:complete len:468 (-),score=52.29 TRINITY_DN33552_c0_g1_i1:53-1339(-)